MLAPLIASLRSQVPMLVRSAPSTGEYLEGVFSRSDLPQCYAVLCGVFGQPAKAFDQPVAFTPDVMAIVEELGGCRLEQCLFFKQDDQGRTIYAVLWPWASDRTRVTLKVGVYEPHAQ